MKTQARLVAVIAAVLALQGAQALAQVATNVPPVVAGAKPVSVRHIKVHAPSIEGNLGGESADRDVVVLLPPSYGASPKKRYPVVYALHGYSIGAEQWTHEIHVPQTVEGAFAKGAQGDDRRPARLQDRPQRLDVFELGDHGRLRDLHRARPGRLRRCALPDDPQSPRAAASRDTRWAATAPRASA